MTRARQTALGAIKIDRASAVSALAAIGEILAVLRAYQHCRVVGSRIIEIEKVSGHHALSTVDLDWRINQQSLLLIVFAGCFGRPDNKARGRDQDSIAEAAASDLGITFRSH
jgi:hypothetical protein